MGWLPLFHHPKATSALVVGASSAALYKCRWLRECGATVSAVAADFTSEQQLELDRLGVAWENIEPAAIHVQGKNLLVIASLNAAWNQTFAQQLVSLNIPMFVWQNPQLSTVSFPAIINRDPVMTAISSSGASPMLSRYLRTRIEGLIPAGYGHLAKLVTAAERAVKAQIPSTEQRRRWWHSVLSGTIGERAMRGDVETAHNELMARIASFEPSEQQWGEVSLVGAGPGDPELLTFKALRLLQQADVVLYDRLVNERILDFARRDAKLLFVGKKRSQHSVPQQDINQMLVEYAKAGHSVCRLKGGDPFIFGRGGEEIAEIAQAGISFQVVPGVTAASGCAAYAGIPLTHRDYAQSVRFVTGHLKDDTSNLCWPALVSAEQTVVFYMGLNAIPLIAQELIQHGAPKDRPAAVIEQGTTDQQRIVISTLSTLVSDVQQSDIESPALIIIGDVVRLHHQLHWFDPAKQGVSHLDSVFKS